MVKNSPLLTYRTDLWTQQGKEKEGQMESSTETYILPYVKQTASGELPWNTGTQPSCCYSVAQSCPTLWDPMNHSTVGFPVHHQFPEPTQTHVHCIGDPINHLVLCCPLLLPSAFPSIRVFPSESALRIRWPKYWSFSFSISLSSEYSGLISFRIDWFLVWSPCSPRDSQESSPTLQFKGISSLALSLFCCPTLTSIHDYWKPIALTLQTFVGKVMSLLLNTLSRFVIAFLSRSKHLLISWLQSVSTVILEPKKIKSVTVSIISPSICIKWWDQMPWSSLFECWILSQLCDNLEGWDGMGWVGRERQEGGDMTDSCCMAEINTTL